MKAIFTLLSVSFFSFCFAQTSFRTAFATYPTGYNNFRSATQLTDSTYVLFGASGVQNDSYGKLSLAKLNTAGTLIATRTVAAASLPQSNAAVAGNLIKMNDGGFVGCAALADTLSLIRWDKNFNVIWYQQYTSAYPPSSEPGYLVRANDGSFFIASNIPSVGNSLLKLDSAGHVIWSKSYAHEDGGFTYFVRMDAAPGNTFILTGYYLTPEEIKNQTNRFQVSVIKIDADGNVIWSRHIKVQGSFLYASGTKVASDGSVMLSGYITYFDSVYTNNDVTQLLAAKMNANGSLSWVKHSSPGDLTNTGERAVSVGGDVVSGMGIDFKNNIPQTAADSFPDPEGGFIFCGAIGYVSPNSFYAIQNPLLLKTDSCGCLKWSRRYHTLKNYSALFNSAIHTYDGGYAFLGDQYTNSGSIYRTMLNKFTPDFQICDEPDSIGSLLS